MSLHNPFIVRVVKRKMKNYLCTSEELEVTEMEAAYVAVEFPVANILTGDFSPIVKYVSIEYMLIK